MEGNIRIAVENADALSRLREIKHGIEDVTDAREKDKSVSEQSNSSAEKQRVTRRQQYAEELNALNEVRSQMARVEEMRDSNTAATAIARERAEVNSQTIAEKALTAELELQKAVKEQLQLIRHTGTTAQIKEQAAKVAELRDEYLKLEAASIKANEAAVSTRRAHLHALAKEELGQNAAVNAIKKAPPALNETAAAAKKCGKEVNLAALVGRQLGINIRQGATAASVQFAILSKGIEAWKSVVSAVVDQLWDGAEVQRERAAVNLEEGKRGLDNRMALANETQKYIDVLREVGSQEKITNDGISRQGEAIAFLTKRYGDLGVEIDANTGRIKNFAEVSARAAEKQKQEKINAINARIKDLEADSENAMAYQNEGFWESIGNQFKRRELYATTAEKEMQRTKENDKEIYELRKQLRELNRQDPKKEAERQKDVEREDARQAAYDNSRLVEKGKELDLEIRILSLRKQNTEESLRQADALAIQAKYDKEREKIASNPAFRNNEEMKKIALTRFDNRRAELESKEMAIRKMSREDKASKKTDDLKSAIREFGKLPEIRETAVSAVSKNSVEGIRLMSRDYGNGKNEAINLDKKRNTLLDMMARNIDKIATMRRANEEYSYGD